MVGLDAAGKTTILYKLKLGEIVTTIPTIGKWLDSGTLILYVEFKSFRNVVNTISVYKTCINRYEGTTKWSLILHYQGTSH